MFCAWSMLLHEYDISFPCLMFFSKDMSARLRWHVMVLAINPTGPSLEELLRNNVVR